MLSMKSILVLFLELVDAIRHNRLSGDEPPCVVLLTVQVPAGQIGVEPATVEAMLAIIFKVASR